MSLQYLASLPSFPVIAALSICLLGWFTDRWPLKFIAVFVCSFAWTWWHASLRIDNILPQHLEKKVLELQGTIVDIPTYTSEGIRFLLLVQKADAPPLLNKTLSLKFYFSSKTVTREQVVIKAGDQAKLKVKLTRPHSYYNDGAFDYEKWLLAKNISARGYVVNYHKQASGEPRLYPILILRQKLFDQVHSFIDNNDTANAISALVLGTSGKLQSWQRKLLNDTGTGHLFAISGLHIGLIFAGFFLFFKMLWVHIFTRFSGAPINRAAASLAVLPVLLYAPLSGFAIPVQRASIFLLCFLANLWMSRSVSRMQIWSTAVIAVVAWEPFSTLFASFWLSFGAVLSILCILSIFGNLGFRQ